MFRLSSRSFVATTSLALSIVSAVPTEGAACLDGRYFRGNDGRATSAWSSTDRRGTSPIRTSSSSPGSSSRRRRRLTRSVLERTSARSSRARAGRSTDSRPRSAVTSGRCSGTSPAAGSPKTARCSWCDSRPSSSTATACSRSRAASSFETPSAVAAAATTPGAPTATSGARENSALGRLLSPHLFRHASRRKTLSARILYELGGFGLEKRALTPAFQPTTVTSSTSPGHVGVRDHRGSDTGGLPAVGLGEGVDTPHRTPEQLFRAVNAARTNGDNGEFDTEASGAWRIGRQRSS